MEDCEIIALYRRREEAAIRETAKKYGALGGRLARNLSDNAEDAEEILSDAYLGVWNTVPPQEPNPLRAYFLRIVRNCATARYHKQHAAKRGGGYDLTLDELAACLPDAMTVDEAVASRELADALNRFLAAQSKENRILFVRRYFYAEPVHALAAAMQLRQGTVSARLCRMRAQLKDELLKEGIFL